MDLLFSGLVKHLTILLTISCIVAGQIYIDDEDSDVAIETEGLYKDVY